LHQKPRPEIPAGSVKIIFQKPAGENPAHSADFSFGEQLPLIMISIDYYISKFD
jgi:hypothetical protein